MTHNIKESRILSLLKREENTSEVLFHHRYPTSTSNVRNACHPFSTKDHFKYQYVVVHNGVCSNTSKLQDEHKALGIEYVSKQENGRFNDSEALTYDLARLFEGHVKTLTASGSIAFIAIKRDRETGKALGVFFGRNTGNPLKIKRTDFSLTLSSEGEGDLVEDNKIFYFNYDTKEMSSRKVTIPGGYNYSQNSGFRSPNYYTRPQATSSVCSPQTRSTPALPSSTSSTPSRSVTSVPSAAWGWDNTDDLNALEASWQEDTDVNDVFEDLVVEGAGDYGNALAIASARVSDLRTRNDFIDEVTSDEESEIDASQQVINEYCENEDNIRFLEGAIRKIQDCIVRQEKNKEKEDDSERRVGFHFRPHQSDVPTPHTPLIAGQKHIVPIIKGSNNFNTGVQRPYA